MSGVYELYKNYDISLAMHFNKNSIINQAVVYREGAALSARLIQSGLDSAVKELFPP